MENDTKTRKKNIYANVHTGLRDAAGSGVNDVQSTQIESMKSGACIPQGQILPFHSLIG